jgi:hypothetical protein
MAAIYPSRASSATSSVEASFNALRSPAGLRRRTLAIPTLEFDDGPEPWPETWEEGHRFRELNNSLSKESDRGLVMSVGHFLDMFLERILRAYLVDTPVTSKLFKGMNAAFGTFSNRIDAAYALGLIDAHEHLGLEGVRGLRNVCAHAVAPDFESDEAVKASVKLATYAGMSPHHPPFVCHGAGLRLASALLNRAYYAEQRRLTPQAWPAHRPVNATIDLRARAAEADAGAAKKKKVRPSRGAPDKAEEP